MITKKAPMEKIASAELIEQIYRTESTKDWYQLLSQLKNCSNSCQANLFIYNIDDAHNHQESLLCKFSETTSRSQASAEQCQNQNCQGFIQFFAPWQYKDSNCCTHYIPARQFYLLTEPILTDELFRACFEFIRAANYPCFDEHDYQFFTELLPHLGYAFKQSYQKLFALKQMQHYQQIFNQLNSAVFICDKHLLVSEKNIAAQQLLKQEDLFSVEGGQLKIKIKHQYQQLQQLVLQLFEQNGPKNNHLLINYEHGGMQKNILMSLDPLVEFTSSGTLQQRVMIKLNFEQLVVWEQFQKEYQLTTKELTLLKALYNKQKLNDLTTKFGVTLNTLRTHLQSIFHKTQVNSQTELFILVSLFKV